MMKRYSVWAGLALLAVAAFLAACTGSGSGMVAPSSNSSGAVDAETASDTQQAIVEAFGANPAEVAAFQASGVGFSELFRAYGAAQVTGQPVATILERRANGAGWDELYGAVSMAPQPALTGTITPTMTPTVVFTVTPTLTPTPLPTATPTPLGTPGTIVPCQAEKVVLVIAEHFNVSPEEVCARRAAGLGFGVIFRVYDLAQATGQTFDAVLAQFRNGAGWGQLYHEAGLSPGGHGLGSAMGGGNGNRTPEPTGEHPGKAPDHPQPHKQHKQSQPHKHNR
jgi:hypothetical protein